MNNENSTKQVLLSIIGIAILVVAVVGVSFAFFTYSKTGEKNNVLTAGSIFFDFTDGTEIKLTDQLPITESAGKALTTGKNGVLEFSVEGYDGSGKGIDYTIYAIKGDVPTGISEKTYQEENRLNDKDIKFYLTVQSKTGESGVLGEASNVTNNFATPALVNTNSKTLTADITDDNKTTAVVLATGKIKQTTKENKQTDSYEFRMWIDGEADGVQLVNDKSAFSSSHVEYPGSVYTQEEFAQKFYSVKIKVVANTATE